MTTEKTTRILLVRSAGRCAVCYRELLISETTWRDVYLGERAHIVGRSTSPGSPRGQHHLDESSRDEPENLVLLCGTCHDDADHQDNLDTLTVTHLRSMKAAHEARIAQILSIPPGNNTAVLRMHGVIGANGAHVDRAAAGAAVIERGRYARFPLSHDISGVEIDLRRQSDPNPGNVAYYRTCQGIIDRVIDRQLAPAIELGEIHHLSVFALARWPLLVHLGLRVGDKVDSDIYQRHRATEGWAWPADGEDNRFDWHLVRDGEGDEVVLVLSMSAAVHASEIPEGLTECAVYRITPAGDVTPHYDIIGTPDSLKSAERALRDVLADIEQHRKSTRNLHVLGAAPTSVCTSLGRALTAGVHPHVVLYDRVDAIYRPAMEVN
jgi:hypothetical protein